MSKMLPLVSYETEKALKKVSLTRIPHHKGYHLSSERLLFCPGLTVTSLDVKENGQIFIGTFSLEQCNTEWSVIVDVMYLSGYLVWQSPQVCLALVSTGASESEIYFITFSYLSMQTHTSHTLSLKEKSSYWHTHTQTDTNRLKRSCRYVAVKGIYVFVISSLNPSVYQGP